MGGEEVASVEVLRGGDGGDERGDGDGDGDEAATEKLGMKLK